MSQDAFSQFASDAFIASPIAKSRSETMICHRPAHSTLQQHQQGHGRLRRPIPTGKDQIVVGTSEQLHLPQYS
ncbi:MAG: hypothetical protein WAV38_21535, partial [Xanthobacteraceae bacterium]